MLLLGLAMAGCAPAPPSAELAAASSAPQAAAARLPLSLGQPLGLTGAVHATAAEPAPVPNREIEGPPDRRDPLAPRFEPMVLRQDRPQGMTFGSEHIRDSAPDRSLETFIPGLPLNDVLPGARVRIPFE
ncbi:hypothetical protein DFH01_12190 [Falsiroseomonas bella]|uniref:Uncharacterized protein n=1 Tax=Falsiroseomonas bella TaxID=2184016 RepID=A0A317FFK9_9PROT|nr:hypothetical protein DFH01_12190 [Falsiroseomonas bella]